ncbi:MAG TPA: ABC transporter ATP-binding protein [Candidatus Babeliales bacterium]|nr:ABC transporter ATP-binding protein [Candidatus Babeliales bacterium]
MDTKHTLTLDSVFKSFTQGERTTTVLDNLTYTFDSERSYAITGSSGSGKSTLMHILCGLDMPTNGAVYFDRHNINKFDTHQRSLFLNKNLGLVFQEPLLLTELSVVENVMLKGLILGQDYAQARVHALELLERVKLVDKADAHPRSLSGGQQQRVSILRALFNRPSFLLADEPTGSLDDTAGRVITDLLCEYQREWGMGLIIASHDAQVAQAMDKVLRLHDGAFCL